MVVVTGEKEDLNLKTKGRVFGVLWMNLGSVSFHEVPAVYLLHHSRGVQEFARTNPVGWKKMGMSLDCLMDRAKITSEKGER